MPDRLLPDHLVPDDAVPDHAVPHHPAGPARVLALAYGFFTLAAGARSAVQLTVHPHRALFAYVLSALAAVIYCSAGIVLVVAERSRSSSRRGQVVRVVVRRLCLVELAAVLVVGAVSLAVPAWFPDATVWSRFGSGYGYVPAVLPLLALWWLHREKHSPATTPDPKPAQRYRDSIAMPDQGDKNG